MLVDVAKRDFGSELDLVGLGVAPGRVAFVSRYVGEALIEVRAARILRASPAENPKEHGKPQHVCGAYVNAFHGSSTSILSTARSLQAPSESVTRSSTR